LRVESVVEILECEDEKMGRGDQKKEWAMGRRGDGATGRRNDGVSIGFA